MLVNIIIVSLGWRRSLVRCMHYRVWCKALGTKTTLHDHPFMASYMLSGSSVLTTP